MNLLYITFGENVLVHSQAAFSVYSFLAHKQHVHSVTILTDAPQYYTHLKDVAHVVPVTKATLQEWEGPHLFFWRFKIRAIEWMCEQYPGKPVLYLDTDTFLYTDGRGLKKQMKSGHALMHELEGPLSKAGSKTEKKMWQQVKGRTFGGVPMKATDNVWNAGVVGTPNTRGGEECRLALQICDEMCAAGVTRRLIEQFALSVALHKVYGLVHASDHIAHYWSSKPGWNKAITEFFTEAYCAGKDRQEVIGSMSQFDYRQHPVKKIEKNTARRLNRLVDRVFKAKKTVYLD